MLKVKDKAYGKALKEFGKKKGWNFEVAYSKDASKIKYRKIGNLLVENIEENVIECIQNWAFADAFATLSENRQDKLGKVVQGVLYSSPDKVVVGL